MVLTLMSLGQVRNAVGRRYGEWDIGDNGGKFESAAKSRCAIASVSRAALSSMHITMQKYF